MMLLASIRLGPVEFQTPVWLLLIPALGVLTVLMAMRSLSGLGRVTRWAALLARLFVITFLAGALAEPQWRKEGKDVSVTLVLDMSQSVPASLQQRVIRFAEEARAVNPRREDRLGMVTIARNSYVQSLPRALNTTLETSTIGATDGTDLASGLRLAMAVASQDAANRIVIASDGNQTTGNLLDEAQRAKAVGVPIDVIPLTYTYESEVMVDRVVAPATARMGEVINLRVVVNATQPADGRLNILLNDEAIDLDPDSPALGTPVSLQPGPNVLQLPIKVPRPGAQRFEAVFEPEVRAGVAVGDARLENNRQQAVTFVSGDSKVLVLRARTDEAQTLVQALTEARIDCDVRAADHMPATLAELNAFDAVVMVNQSAYDYTQKQQEDLRQYVHDGGGGLIMIGGPDAFGAGGWIGSPVEDALPVRLDPPQKRQMPKGALALIVHSVEIPDGVYYGKKVSEAAVNALSRLDDVGIVEFDWQRGTRWVHPLGPVGDGTATKRAIQNLTFGDMPDFTPSFELALAGLKKSDAGQKLTIVISDGDPSPPGNALLRSFRDAGVSITTVAIGVHGITDQTTMQTIAERTGGRFYNVQQAAVATLPQIFFKEAQTVRRSLLWEGTPFSPSASLGAAEQLRGIGLPVPPIAGYVVTADREGLSLVSMRGKENDPILAQWQYGLGRAIAFTSDASPRWAQAWLAWPQYRAFWEQQVRWVMRPTGSANIRVTTDVRGDQTILTVDVLDAHGERLNFATFVGRVALPDGSGEHLQLRQVGPGRYQGLVKTEQPGSYLTSLRYRAASQDGRPMEGAVQAAINRPFADEFRALKDNAGLLEQARALTGGRLIGPDPQRADLWAREGLKMPVTTTPIWLAVALGAVGLFLADVGVRRVRIDPAAIARAARRVLVPGKARAAQTESLRQARAQAKARLEEQAAAGPDQRVYLPSPQTASRKFEAAPDARPGEVLTARAEPLRPPPRPEEPKSEPSKEEGMSRLLKAKQRAREETEE